MRHTTFLVIDLEDEEKAIQKLRNTAQKADVGVLQLRFNGRVCSVTALDLKKLFDSKTTLDEKHISF